MAEIDNKAKLERLRAEMNQRGLQGYLVPRADEWQGEYVPARAARLGWLTGFTGSAGTAQIATDKAAVFSDSRYTLQMTAQLDPALYEGVLIKTTQTANEWLMNAVPAGGKVGYDPRLFTVADIAERQKKLAEKNIELVPVEGNLVDAVWDDQPEHPADKVAAYPEKYAGQSSADKRAAVAEDVKKAGAKAVLLTDPASIAWLLNIRGGDVPHVPVALSYAVLHDSGEVDWFVPLSKLSSEVRQHIGNHVRTHDFADMPAVLKKLAPNGKMLIDEGSTPVWFKALLEKAGAEFTVGSDPTILRKACKNETERKNIANAHIKDGVALVKFWKWVDEEAPKGKLTELDVVAKLRGFREQQDGFKDDSFDAIVGWASNGAIVHYRADEESNKQIKGSGLLLVDSGGQYLEGTTDNTRTRAIGKPTQEMRENFTRVLKGHIAVASAHFTARTTGQDLDMLARQFLRKAGLDYGHGTGHGVGAYLSVHEPGAGISPRFGKPLKPGMLVSNEPGYYKEGEYGIRIENLVFVAETGDEELSLRFNTVSLTPIDPNLIDAALLDADEIAWLNAYHKEVYDKLSPHLDAAEKAWLKKETAPIGPAP